VDGAYRGSERLCEHDDRCGGANWGLKIVNEVLRDDFRGSEARMFDPRDRLCLGALSEDISQRPLFISTSTLDKFDISKQIRSS
jgi:hypothetical protein